MKEYKIGEIFELNGQKYQVIEDDTLTCRNCCFTSFVCRKLNIGSCISRYRKDKKNICFKLVEE